VISGLTPATSYTFRIIPVFNTGDGTDCERLITASTTNAGVACVAPTGLQITNITETTAQASWLAVAGATGYQYHLELNGGADGPWINVGSALNTGLNGLVEGETYSLTVRAIIGGVPCTQEVSDTFDTDSATGSMTIQHNATSETTVASITPGFFTIDSGTLPMSGGDPDITGVISAFTGNINIELYVGPCDLLIFKNGVYISTEVLGPGMNTVAISVLATDDLKFIFTDPGAPSPVEFMAYYGFKDENTVLGQSAIEAGTSGVFADGAQVDANYMANSAPKFLWVAIPVGQPLKTKWYTTVISNGNIGTPDDLFDAPVVSGTYNFYITNYQTSMTEAVCQFKNS
jgi:hypothetical protein